MSAENKIFITPEGEHDYNKKYKQYTFVTHTKDDTTKVYMSIKDVPQFVSILDINYWKFVKSDVGGGEEVDISGKADKVDTPNVIHLDNYEHSFDTLTDKQVAGLRVGDIIEWADINGGENTSRSFVVYTIDDSDVVHLIEVGINEIIILYELVKSGDYWTLSEAGIIRCNIPVETSLPESGGILPNVVYKLGTLPNDASITIILETPTDDNIANVYTVTFDTGNWETTSDRGPSVSWGLPITTYWADGEAPSIEPNTCYEVSIMDNIAVCVTAEKVRNLPVEHKI